jgi:GntR family transcriptional regulator
VAPDGFDRVKAHRKQKFIEQDLPIFFTNISLLHISTEEIGEWYKQFKSKDNENKQ